MEISVLAFDPGETTGWCAMTLSKSKFLITKQYRLDTEVRFSSGQVNCRDDENDGVRRLLNVWADFPLACVVHEDFIIDFNKIDQARHTLSPVRITAKFEFGAYLHGLSEEQIFIQNRSPVKTTCTDDRMKVWGLYDSHSGRHARDATRHAFYFFRRCHGDSLKARELRWRAWPLAFEDPRAVVAPKRVRPAGERVAGLG